MRLNFKLDPLGEKPPPSVRQTKGDWLDQEASPVIVKATYRAMGLNAYARLTFLLS